jgi:hypothetical protein
MGLARVGNLRHLSAREDFITGNRWMAILNSTVAGAKKKYIPSLICPAIYW